MKWLEHLKTINRHKKYVMELCFKLGLYKQGILHDMSKYCRNKHHLEYWIEYSLDGDHSMTGMKMPLKYVVEMFCDRVAASKNYRGEEYRDSDPYEYYMKSKDHLLIHPDTARLLESMLLYLKKNGEEKTLRYIRKHILSKKTY